MAVQRTSGIGAAAWSTRTIDVASVDGPVEVAGANRDRQAVSIISDPDNSADVYLTPDTSRVGGIRLVPGAGYELHSSAQVFVRAAAGTARVVVVETTGVVC